MNERIQELAKQAYRQDCLESNPNWKEGVAFERFMGLMDSTFEKFAELIIKESIVVACSLYMEASKAEVRGMEQLLDKIYEHFGVEE